MEKALTNYQTTCICSEFPRSLPKFKLTFTQTFPPRKEQKKIYLHKALVDTLSGAKELFSELSMH